MASELFYCLTLSTVLKGRCFIKILCVKYFESNSSSSIYPSNCKGASTACGKLTMACLLVWCLFSSLVSNPPFSFSWKTS
ncbi:hypothetical protein VNO77_15875 [Canavalia gladiata]|uniref:Uncharacterized protein n=1 Tax=Canavalia gladiata TaxID=3824 RepID=A0AAN9QPF1_CANGL